MDTWANQSALSLARAIQDRKISSSDLLAYFKERHERLNPSVNAIVATNFDQAAKAAAEADSALAQGRVLGPLHGLPMTLKDNLEIIGMPTTYGSEDFSTNMPKHNADVVQSVLDAGAVVFGKTNLPLFGMDTQSFNGVYGQTNNPWDVSRTPGGSSGGAAAALAAGLTGLEIGNDIGGSIRLPAHFCGIYGHKPSYNIVSMHGATKPWSHSNTHFPVETDLAVNGPLARSAEDLLLAMGIIVGAPGYQRKAVTINLPEPRRKSLKDFKVGVWLDDPDGPPDSEVAAVLSNFIDRLAGAGVKLVNKRPDVQFKRSAELRNLFESATLAMSRPLDQATTMTHRDWLKLNAERADLRQKWDDYFTDVDVMLCPVVRIPAHAHDHTDGTKRTVAFNNDTLNYWDVVLPWNSLSLVSYLPATVAPAGFTPGGLPIGIQIVGPYLEDLTPIQFAMNLEQEIIGPYQLPDGFSD